MDDNAIRITFVRTTTKIGMMEIVDSGYSAPDIVSGVADGTLVISFGGRDGWGSICRSDPPQRVVAHIIEAEDDASGAEYGNLLLSREPTE